VAFALAALAWSCAARPEPPAAVYGSPPSLTGRSLPLAHALSDANLGRPLSIKAGVAEVCRAKGCWMVLTDGQRSVRVTFRDYAFFVPKDLAGKTVVAEGVLSRRLVSPEEAAHLAEESGSAESISPTPREEWLLVATSVVLLADSR
jgi:hypothetical protein